MDHFDPGASAACYGIPTELFFPEPDDLAGFHAAKRICERCPIIDACRDYAVEHFMQGLWGGTSEAQRTKLRRGQKLPFAKTKQLRTAVARMADSGMPPHEIAGIVGKSVRTVNRKLAEVRAARKVAA